MKELNTIKKAKKKTNEEDKVEEKDEEVIQATKKEVEPIYIPPPPFKPLIRFPQRLRKVKSDEQFVMLLDMFKFLQNWRSTSHC